jgi:hypothetical protein
MLVQCLEDKGEQVTIPIHTQWESGGIKGNRGEPVTNYRENGGWVSGVTSHTQGNKIPLSWNVRRHQKSSRVAASVSLAVQT